MLNNKVKKKKTVAPGLGKYRIRKENKYTEEKELYRKAKKNKIKAKGRRNQQE